MTIDKGRVALWLIENFGMDTIDDFTIIPYEAVTDKKRPTLADELDNPHRGSVKIEFPFNGRRRCVVFKAAFANHFKEQ